MTDKGNEAAADQAHAALRSYLEKLPRDELWCLIFESRQMMHMSGRDTPAWLIAVAAMSKFWELLHPLD